MAIRPRFLPSSHRHNGQLVRRACIGVYRPIATAAGVLLPFVIYAALSSAPQQRSYSFDRSNPSILYIYISSSSFHAESSTSVRITSSLDIVIRYRCTIASNRRARSTRDRVLLLPSLFPRPTVMHLSRLLSFRRLLKHTSLETTLDSRRFRKRGTNGTNDVYYYRVPNCNPDKHRCALLRG